MSRRTRLRRVHVLRSAPQVRGGPRPIGDCRRLLLALSTFGVTKHSKKHAYNILVAIAPVVEHACARCPGQTSVRYMFCERVQTESCLVKAPASHTDESVQVTSELKCTGVQEDTTRNVRVKCAHVGNRSTHLLTSRIAQSDVIFKTPPTELAHGSLTNRVPSFPGSVSEQIVHTKWILKMDSKTNLVSNSIEQQVSLRLLQLSQAGASYVSTRDEACGCELS